MGLDMYLEGERFLWDFGGEAETVEAVRAAIKGAIGDTPGKVKTIVTEAAYWRKANAIHKWFVDNVQDGVDECQRAYVERNQLTTLRDLCKEVLANRDNPESKLPSEAGFFFGGTEYDEYYYEDLESTVAQLDAILDEEKYPPGEWSFYYQSSW